VGSQPDSNSIPPQQSYIVNTLSRPGVQENVSNQEERINFDPILTDNEDKDDEYYNGSEDEDEYEDEDREEISRKKYIRQNESIFEIKKIHSKNIVIFY
jgi:formylmethanofuran dehydrogenase subunit E